jgi:hypothetical protein
MYPESDQDFDPSSHQEYEGETASRSSVAVSELAAPMELEPATSVSRPTSRTTSRSEPVLPAPSPAVAGLTPLVADHLVREIRSAYEVALSFTVPTFCSDLAKKYVHILTDLCTGNRSWNKPGAGQPHIFSNITRNARKFFGRKVLLFLPRDEWCGDCADKYWQFVNDPTTRSHFFWPCAVVDDSARCIACDLYRLDGMRETPPEAGPLAACSHKRDQPWTAAKYQAAKTAAESATATAAPPPQQGPASASASGAFTSPSSAGSTQAISDPVLSTSTLPPVARGVAPLPVINPVVTTTILTGVGSSIANPIVFDDDDDDDDNGDDGDVKQPASRVQGTTTQIGESSTDPAERLSTVKTEQSSTVKTEQSVIVKTENANVREKMLAFAKTIEDFVGNMMPGPIASNVKAVATRLKADCAASQPCCEALECAIVGLRAQTIIVVVHQNLGGTLREMEELSETL